MLKPLTIVFLSFLINPILCHSAATDYLILEDIQQYHLFTGIKGRVFSGPPFKYSQTATPGVLWAVGHLKSSHENYNASYTRPSSKWPFVKVEVTVHNDPDANKWVLHELDAAYRNYYGVPSLSYYPEQIDGNTILIIAVGGHDYRWISGNNVVQIEYSDGMMTLPEPLEVVKAYLRKHPSTLPSITLRDLRSDIGVAAWIKTEMDRRLWLCGKRIDLLLNETTADKDDPHLHDIGKDLDVFLDYRYKYFGKKADGEKQLIDGYLRANDISAIKTKLAEYQAWWVKHKEAAISVPKI
jgi:hypothetical protein